jgi:hypothetical protein
VAGDKLEGAGDLADDHANPVQDAAVARLMA